MKQLTLVVLVGFILVPALSWWGQKFAPPSAQAVVGDVTIDQSTAGTFTARDMVAQKLTDSANSSYFLDPAATGDSLVAAGKVTAGSFAGDGSLLTGIAGTPAGAVVFFNLAACPTGWTELVAARGMYMVGLPASGTLAGTSGTALTNLESRAVGQHLHSASQGNHMHSILFAGSGALGQRWVTGSGSYTDSGWGFGGQNEQMSTVSSGAITIGNAGSVAGTNAPYIQLLTCQKS